MLRFEPLEPRHMLDGNPIIQAHIPDGLATEPVASILLDLTEPVVGADARDAESYELLHLGVDRMLGGGDDHRLQILPKYIDGSTHIELATTSDFAGWTEIDYAFPAGILGTWNVAEDGASVQQLDNGGATFFVSDFDPGDTQFVGRILVEEAAVDDDFVGVVFGFRQHAETGKPASYYLLSWKKTGQGEAEGGLKLAKVTGSGQLINPPDLWDLDPADPHVDVLLDGPTTGWQDQTEYEFHVGYDAASGTIDLLIRHSTEEQIVWQVDQFVDPAPLGAGKVGFYNFSQPSVRYTNLDYTTSLPDGYYQLTAVSGEPGLRDLLGNALDGNGDGTGGDDFVVTFGIDTVTPAVEVDLQADSDSGMLDTDNLTNVTTPVFDVTVNKIGRVEVDFDGDGTIDAQQVVDTPGTYPFSAAYGTDGTYSVEVDFFSASGDPDPAHATLDVTLDTQPAELEPGAVEADAPWGAYDLTFTESVDPATLTIDDITLLDPTAGPIAIDSITGSDAAYTLSFPGQSALGNYTLSIGPAIADRAGNLMTAPVERVIALNPDQFGPVVDAVAIQADAVAVTFLDASGMNVASVQTAGNYQLLASGGDGSFGDGNEIDLSDRIGTIAFDPTTGVATLPLLVPLEDERYQLTVNGDAPDGVRDTWDNLLLAGNDYVAPLTLDTQPGSITVDLRAPSDSGISDTDNITNVTAPSLDVTVNEAGRIDISYGAHGSESLTVTAAGTSVFTSPTLPDGVHSISATFTPAADTVRQSSLAITVDTQPPTINAGTHTAQAPWRVRTVTFDRPIAAPTFTETDVVLTGPDAAEITPVTVSPDGNAYNIDFGYQTNPGSYRFDIGPNIEDLAGNPMQAVFSELVVLAADIEAPYVADFSPIGPIDHNVSSLRVDFSETLPDDVFDRADVAVTGPGGSLDAGQFNVVALSESAFRVDIPEQSAEGDYTVTIGPAVEDHSGNPMNAAYQALFSIDRTRPAVLQAVPSGSVGQVVDHVRITFDEPIRTETFTPSDVTLLGPDDQPISISTVSMIGPDTYDVTFAPQRANGTYSLALGPNIDDPAGNAMAVSFSGGFEIALPDLTLDPADPDAVTLVPTTARLGDSMSVAWIVDNVGAAAAVGLWNDAIWLSEDDTLDAGDVLLATTPKAGPVGIGGEYSASRQVTLPLDGTFLEGIHYIIVETDTDGTLAESAEQYNWSAEPIDLAFPPLSDLTVSRIDAPADAIPGEEIELSWQVLNTQAQPAVGSWTESIRLVSVPPGEIDILVAQFDYNGPVAQVSPADRTETITLPPYGASGDLRFVVVVDPHDELLEEDETNNRVEDDATINVPAFLTLALPGDELLEGDNQPAARAVVTRHGILSQPLTVTLSSDDTTELTVPPIVVIPAGQHSTAFELTAVADGIPDGPQMAMLSATAPGLIGTNALLQIVDVDVPTLTWSLDDAEITEGDSTTATVTRDLVTSEPLVVSLLAAGFESLDMPVEVMIPGDQPSVTFTIGAIEDSLPERDAVVRLTAYAPQHVDATADLAILDDDLPTLSLTLTPGEVSEGAGAGAVMGIVSRAVTTDGDLVVNLASDDTTEAAVPRTVTIPANLGLATFLISAIDDEDPDDHQTVTISATGVYADGGPMDPAGPASASAALTVLDDEGPTLSVAISRDLVGENLVDAATLTVTHNVQPPPTADLVVTLQASDAAVWGLPGQIVIPANQSSSAPVSFHTGEVDGIVGVAIGASAPDYVAGADTVVVTDAVMPDLTISRIDAPSTAWTQEYFDVGYEILNQGLGEAAADNADTDPPGSWTQRVFLSDDPVVGDDILVGNFQFSGTLGTGVAFGRTVPVRAPLRPGDYWVIVTTDLSDRVDEVLEGDYNTTVSRDPVRVQAAYGATVQADLATGPGAIKLAVSGEPIVFTGEATSGQTGAPEPFALVNIHIAAGGTERVISVVTDEAGRFTTAFSPLAGEGGHYRLWASHPGVDAMPPAAQDEFILQAMRPVPSQLAVNLLEGQTVEGSLPIGNSSDITLTGLVANAVGVPESLTVNVSLTDNTVSGGEAIGLNYEITAVDASITTATLSIEVASAEGVAAEVPVTVRVEALRPRLVADVGQLRSAMVRGEQRSIEFRVTNAGGLETGPIAVELPEVSWLSTALPNDAIESLAPGESATVVLVLSPAADQPLARLDGSLLLRAQNEAFLSMPFSFVTVSQAEGDLSITVVDEYTYYAEGQPKVAGASIALTNVLTGQVVAQGVSAADGLFSLQQIDEGYYRLQITAEDHQHYDKTILVAAAEANQVVAFLERQTVSYTFNVTPTEIEDTTRIVIETTFETNVPFPVLTVEIEEGGEWIPAAIDLSKLTTEFTQFDMRITNHGLIAADNAAINYTQNHPDYEIVPLIEEIGTIPANGSVTVPVLYRRKAPTNANAAREAKRAACSLIDAKVVYTVICGIEIPKSAPIVHYGPLPECPSWVPVGGRGGRGGVWVPGPAIAETEPSVSLVSCEECLDELAKAVLNCITKFLPLGTLICVGGGAYSCAGEGVSSWRSAGECGANFLECIPVYGEYVKVVRCYYDILNACIDDEGAGPAGRRRVNRAMAMVGGRVGATIEEMTPWLNRLEVSVEPVSYFYGSHKWAELGGDKNVQAILAAYHAAMDNTSPDATGISDSERQQLLAMPRPDEITEYDINKMVDRWNRTGEYYAAGIFNSDQVPEGWDPEFMAADLFQSKARAALDAVAEAEAAGFGSVIEGAQAAVRDLYTELSQVDAGGGACAQVKIQVSQDAVLTRDAFEATLTIDNSTDSPVTQTAADITITTIDGRDVTEWFGIYPPELVGITATDGSGVIDAHSTGTVDWLMVPAIEAAPDRPTIYMVSGTASYTEDGTEVTIPLLGVPITVYPQAELQLDYFHQRDVFSDDPWTEPIEPAEPYTLAVMVKNRGAGEARNLKIISAQPEIIENEKGLLIDFNIIATEVAGQNLQPTLKADFGNVAPGEIEIARWLLTSTLQGQFIDYQATFEHVDGLGDNHLSLIKEVNIHELIHVVQADHPADDGKPDFLVNEVVDPDDLADTLYLSDGRIESVALATNAVPDGQATPNDRVVELTVDMAAGWGYLLMDPDNDPAGTDGDPGGGDYRLVSVERVDGSGTSLPAANFWQTNRTFIELGQRPIYEDNLHLLDHHDTQGTYTYRLHYEPRDQVGPAVLELPQPDEGVTQEPVTSIDITLSEPIDGSTFGSEDLTLTYNGGPDLITTAVTVQHVADTTYRIGGLSGLTAEDGSYTLSVNTAGIIDLFGNAGSSTGTTSWLKVASVPGIVEVIGIEDGAYVASPPEMVDLVFTEPITPGSFTLDDITFSREPGTHLATDGLSITQLGPSLYRLGGLDVPADTDGQYHLTIDATGVTDLDGNSGLGETSIAWTLDTVAPELTLDTSLPGDMTNGPIDRIRVEFSEPITRTTLNLSTLTLILENPLPGPNRITPEVRIEHVEGNLYEITGLRGMTGDDGHYVLTVDGGMIRDPAGNPASATTVNWDVDATPPDPVTNLGLWPQTDTGVSSSDGVTTLLNVTITGDLPEADTPVELVDTTTGIDLGEVDTAGMSFSHPVVLAAPGIHRIRARVFDAAGNHSDSFFDVFVDLTNPMIEQIATPSGAIEIEFSEPMGVESMILDGSIVGAFALTRLDLGAIALGTERYSYDPVSRVLSISTVGIGVETPYLDEGNYQLVIDGGQLPDLAGNLLRGGSGGIVQFDFPAFDAAENVRAGGADIRVDNYSVPSVTDWNSDGVPDLIVGERTELGEGKVRVYLNAGTVAAPVYGDYYYAMSEGIELALPGSGCLGVFPQVFDWDGDGRKDLVVGRADGKVQVLLNTNTDTDPRFGPAEFVQVGAPGAKSDIDVGDRATLDIIDYNNDGRHDLVLGAMDGTVRVLINEAASGPPDFGSARFVSDGTGGDLAVPGGRSSVDVVDLNGDGRKDLVLGNTDGQLLFYANTGSDADPAFDGFEPLRAEGAVIDLPDAPRSRPFVADVDGDGVIDLLVGSRDGLVRLYRGQATAAIGEAPHINGGEPGATYTYTFNIHYHPADFNYDGYLDVDDLDLLTLVGDLGTGLAVPPADARFDLTGDSTVDTADLDQWLADAARANGLDSPYPRGDANLDGDVDIWAFDGSGDAQVLSSNLGRAAGAKWSEGDFNGDGDVDVWAPDGSGDAQLLSSNLGKSLDIAFEQAIEEESDAIDPLCAAVDWQYGFESTQTKAAKRKEVDAIVDLLFATEWQ